MMGHTRNLLQDVSNVKIDGGGGVVVERFRSSPVS